MKVMIACETSGKVRDAFLARGHDAISCDILPTDSPGPHIQADIMSVDLSAYDLLIGHPPCTYICNSSVRWFTTIPKKPAPGVAYGPDRWRELAKATEIFYYLLDSGVPKIAIENPIPHGYAMFGYVHRNGGVHYAPVALHKIGRYSQIIQPYQFGHGETKQTCLWLQGLPPLQPTNIVEGRKPRVHHESPSPDRWKKRSVTYTGIAEAMAQQWG